MSMLEESEDDEANSNDNSDNDKSNNNELVGKGLVEVKKGVVVKKTKHTSLRKNETYDGQCPKWRTC